MSTDTCATCGHIERRHYEPQKVWPLGPEPTIGYVTEFLPRTHCMELDCRCGQYIPQPALGMAHVLNDRRLEWKP